MRRDLNRLVTYFVRHVIPPTETALLADLDRLYKAIFYQPPEMQGACWNECSQLLQIHLGDPAGVEWKETVARIFCDQEKIPEWFSELNLTEPPADIPQIVSIDKVC